MDSLDMLNDLDMVSILDNSSTNGLWSNTSLPTTSSVSTTSTGHPVSTHSGLHPTSYASFSNSYLEDLNGSASVMVNPNNVMPLHHPLQHQQVTSLSVNTRYRMSHHIFQSLVAFSNIVNSWPKFIFLLWTPLDACRNFFVDIRFLQAFRFSYTNHCFPNF